MPDWIENYPKLTGLPRDHCQSPFKEILVEAIFTDRSSWTAATFQSIFWRLHQNKSRNCLCIALYGIWKTHVSVSLSVVPRSDVFVFLSSLQRGLLDPFCTVGTPTEKCRSIYKKIQYWNWSIRHLHVERISFRSIFCPLGFTMSRGYWSQMPLYIDSNVSIIIILKHI